VSSGNALHFQLVHGRDAKGSWMGNLHHGSQHARAVVRPRLFNVASWDLNGITGHDFVFLFQSAPQNYLLVFVSEKTGLPSEQLAGVREVLEEFK